MMIDFTNSNLRPKLDHLERVVVLALFIYLLYRFAEVAMEAPLNLLYLFTEGLVVLMVLFRRTTDQISVAWRDWGVAFGGTFLVMMVMPGAPIEGASKVAAFLLVLGVGVSVLAKFQLRRSFGLVAANRGLKTTGVYAMVRHPMYVGYFFTQAGMLLINFSLWNVTILSAWSVLQLLRINAEERVLSRDPAYSQHMTRVTYKLVPYLY